MAVFSRPVVSFVSAASPTAVLDCPVVLLESALEPTAVLVVPVVFELSALSPKNVFWLMMSQPCSQTARACGESPKQASTNGMRRNAPKGERFIKVLNGRVVFIMPRVLRKSGHLARRIVTP